MFRIQIPPSLLYLLNLTIYQPKKKLTNMGTNPNNLANTIKNKK